MFADLLFINLGDEPRIFGSGALTIEADSDPKVRILDLGGVYYPGGKAADSASTVV